jgi:hypothetical protein
MTVSICSADVVKTSLVVLRKQLAPCDPQVQNNVELVTRGLFFSLSIGILSPGEHSLPWTTSLRILLQKIAGILKSSCFSKQFGKENHVAFV